MLIVEDMGINRSMLHMPLEEDDDVLEALNGQEALEVRRGEQIIASGVREITAKLFEHAVIKKRIGHIIELAWQENR